MSAATVADLLDRQLAGWKPSRVVYATALGLAGVCTGAKLLRKGRLLSRLDQLKWRLIRIVGAVIVSKKINEAAEGIKFKKVKAGDQEFPKLPATGMSPTDIMGLCKLRHGEMDTDYSHGECSGMVYHGGAAHTKLVNDTMAYFQWSNPLHVDCFGAVRKMEAEIVAMTLAMYHGEAAKSGNACGSLTSGGTESIGMAMRSYREWGRATRCLKTFSIVAPITIHPAFDKAADYYGMEIIKVPINPATGVVDPEELEKYIRHDTVVICGSTPCFPTGTIDRIADLAQVAKRNGVGLHVDSCLGGFIMPFLQDAGFDQPVTDFRIDGVTTISADTHKYGFAPKGTSVVLYHSKDLRRYQFFAMSEWPGGIYASPAAAGSKAGNVIAGTWAAMISIGQQGYVDSCKRIVTARKTVEDGVKTIPGLRILGFPGASALAFTSDRVDCFELNDQLVKKGWMLNPLQFPSGLQISFTMLHTQPGVAERLVSDIKQVAAALEAALPPGAKKVPEQGSSLYGSQQRVADRTIINDVLRCFCDKYYVP